MSDRPRERSTPEIDALARRILAMPTEHALYETYVPVKAEDAQVLAREVLRLRDTLRKVRDVASLTLASTEEGRTG